VVVALGRSDVGSDRTSVEHEAQKATEIGVTAKEITSPWAPTSTTLFAPGLFKGAVDGVKGARKYHQQQGGRRRHRRPQAGGRLQSTRTSANNDSRNGGDQPPCSQDYAQGRHFMLFLSTVDDEVNLQDQAGRHEPGRPTCQAFTNRRAGRAFRRWRSPWSPSQTRLQHQRTRTNADVQRQPLRLGSFLLQARTRTSLARGDDLRNEHEDAARGGQVLINTRSTRASSRIRRPASRACPQSAYTPIINNMKNNSSNLLVQRVGVVERGPRAQRGTTAGIDRVTWVCTIACYDKGIYAQKDVMEGQYVTMTSCPSRKRNTIPRSGFPEVRR